MTTTAPAETVSGKADETLTVPEDEDKSQAGACNPGACNPKYLLGRRDLGTQ